MDFNQARENSIEIFDDNFGRNTLLTRSARMRKFKFYQYKPIRTSTTRSPSSQSPTVLLQPRDDVVKGKVGPIVEQSKELSELDEQIVKLEKKIADLKKQASSSSNEGGGNGQNNNNRSNTNNNNNSNINKLDEIFQLVNEKNDLLRRQMQLNILEQEKALEKANEELTKELRSLMSIDDSKKSPADLERQQYLYDQSVALVNKRNELVFHLDVQEKGIEEDNELKETLKMTISNTSTRNKLNGQDQNCCIQ